MISYQGRFAHIYEIRHQKVMFDFDLAELYEVEPKVLNQAVQRNIERFPEDFAFKLTEQEMFQLEDKNKLSSGWGGKRKSSRVFTEHGILMLSSVLRSEKAVKVNIQIMRTFIALREALLSYGELNRKIEEMESKYDAQFTAVFETIRSMLYEDEENSRRLGFNLD